MLRIIIHGCDNACVLLGAANVKTGMTWSQKLHKPKSSLQMKFHNLAVGEKKLAKVSFKYEKVKKRQ